MSQLRRLLLFHYYVMTREVANIWSFTPCFITSPLPSPPQFTLPQAEMGSRIVRTASHRKTVTDNANRIPTPHHTTFLITRKGTGIKEGGEIRKEGIFIGKGVVYKIKFMVIESGSSGQSIRCLSFHH